MRLPGWRGLPGCAVPGLPKAHRDRSAQAGVRLSDSEQGAKHAGSVEHAPQLARTVAVATPPGIFRGQWGLSGDGHRSPAHVFRRTFPGPPQGPPRRSGGPSVLWTWRPRLSWLHSSACIWGGGECAGALFWKVLFLRPPRLGRRSGAVWPGPATQHVTVSLGLSSSSGT